METEEVGHPEKGEERNPPWKSMILSVFRTFGNTKRGKHGTRHKPYTDHQLNERRIAGWTRNVGWFTFALVLTSAVGNWIIYSQLKEMRSSSEDTKQLIKAAQDSAKAAQDAVAIAKDTAQRQLRAYIAHGQATISIDGTKYLIGIKIRNAGQTPAQNISGDVEIYLLSEIRKLRIRIRPITEPMTLPIIAIGRDGDATISAWVDFSTAERADISDILNDVASAFVFTATSRYLDVFGDAHRIRAQYRCPRGIEGKWICEAGPNGSDGD
jgi:uncharacterized protein (UPF0333 family)